MHREFFGDLKLGGIVELGIKAVLKRWRFKVLPLNKDKRHDILAIKNGQQVKIEVKGDFASRRTGNIAIEYFHNGSPSGIDATEAHFWWIKAKRKDASISSFFVSLILPVPVLKQIISERKYHTNFKGGGDKGVTDMYLFSFEVLEQYSLPYKDEQICDLLLENLPSTN